MHQKTIVGEYIDHGVSDQGGPELQLLLRDAKQGFFDQLLVWKINRVSHGTIGLLKIVDELSQQNISFRSFSENLETETAMGKFALQILRIAGELERDTFVDIMKS